MNYAHLADLENSAYRTVVDDGVLDICLGFMVLASGLVFATDVHLFGEVDLPILLFLLIYPLWKVLRSRVVEPRAGFVQLHAARMEKVRRAKQTIFYLYLTSVVIFFALVGWDAGWSEQLRAMGTILFGLAISIPIAIAAVLFQVRRWFIYAGVLMAATVFEFVTESAFGTGWLVASGVILISGLVVLATLLRAHTVHPDLEGIDA